MIVAAFLICLALAAVVAGFLGLAVCVAAARAEDNHYQLRRTPGMGDAHAAESTPIFDQLCLEHLDAELEADR